MTPENVDLNTTNFIGRPEYEARHAELQSQFIRVDTKLDQALAKLDTFNAAVNKRIDEIVEQRLKDQAAALQKEATSWHEPVKYAISFVSGIGVYVIAQYLIIHFVH